MKRKGDYAAATVGPTHSRDLLIQIRDLLKK
jgi:hypothetical protein